MRDELFDKLYAFQKANVENFLSRPAPRRMWLCDEMGLGKSLCCVTFSRLAGHHRVLFVVLGNTRTQWLHTWRTWNPSALEPAVVDKGFHRKNQSKPEEARIAAKLQADSHIVSYDLLGKLLDAAPCTYDAIYFDEFHELVKWRSGTREAISALLARNPQADMVCISGTPIMAQPLDAWTWLKLTQPDRWGEPTKTGEPPFLFRRKYGIESESEYSVSGYVYSGVNPETLPEFRRHLGTLVRRVTRAEVGDQLPALDVGLLAQDTSMSREDFVVDWLQTALKESPYVGVFTKHHAPLTALVDAVQAHAFKRHGKGWVPPAILVFEEGTTVAQREKEIAAFFKNPRGILFAPIGQISTGLDTLTPIKQWILAEPVTTALKVVQLATRFSRLNEKNPAPAVGKLLYHPSHDEDTMFKLKKQLDEMNGLVGAGTEGTKLLTALNSQNEDSLLDIMKTLGRSYRGDVETDDDDS